jgi:hypothetical protein
MLQDLSLHVLDLAQNSLEAGAAAIRIRGMDEVLAGSVGDPFVTTRTSRKVGLGIPFLQEAARCSGGKVTVDTRPGGGTRIAADFGLSHIDRPPLGNMAETIKVLVACNPSVRIRYSHESGQRAFSFDTDEIRHRLGGASLSDPEVVRWIGEHCREGIYHVRGGEPG